MAQIVKDTFASGGSFQDLTDHTGETGATWLPHPDYTGTIRISTSQTVFNNPVDTDEALYYASGKLVDGSGFIAKFGACCGTAAGETLSTGRITLTGGASGSVNTITVNGVNIIPGGAVAFDTSLALTANDIANQINTDSSTPEYRSVSGYPSAFADIKAAPGTGTGPNGLVVNSTRTTITATHTNMTGGAFTALDSGTGFCYGIKLEDKSFYRIRFNHGTSAWVLEKCVNGAISQLATASSTAIAPITEHAITVTLIVNGASHKVEVSSQSGLIHTLSATDSSIDLDDSYFGIWAHSSFGLATSGSGATLIGTKSAFMYGGTLFAAPSFLAGQHEVTVELPQFSISSEGETAGAGSASGTLAGTLTRPWASSFTNTLGPPPATLDGTLPEMTSSFSGVAGASGSISLVYTQISGAFLGLAADTGILSARCKPFTASFAGGVTALSGRMPRPWTSSYTGTYMPPGVLSGRLTKYSSAFTATTTFVGTLSARTKLYSASFSGKISQISRLSMLLPEPYGVFTAACAPSGALLLRTKSFVFSSTGRISVSGSFVGEFPEPITSFSSYKLYTTLAESLVVNTRTFAHSNYTYGFLSYAAYNGRLLGIKADGIYQLDIGDQDQTTNIDASIATGLVDYGVVNLKHLDAFYSTYRTDGKMKVYVATDEGTEYGYDILHYNSEVLKQRRVLIGKGLRGKNYKIRFTNVNGSDFEIDGVDLIVKVTKRGV